MHRSKKGCQEHPDTCVFKANKKTSSIKKKSSSKKHSTAKKQHTTKRKHSTQKMKKRTHKKRGGGTDGNNGSCSGGGSESSDSSDDSSSDESSGPEPATREEGAMMPTQLCKAHSNRKACTNHPDECIWYAKKGCSQRIKKTKKTPYKKIEKKQSTTKKRKTKRRTTKKTTKRKRSHRRGGGSPATREEGAYMPTQLCKVHSTRQACIKHKDECIWYADKKCSQRIRKTKKTPYAKGGGSHLTRAKKSSHSTRVRKHSKNPWHNHVKQYAGSHNMTFFQALKHAKKSYKGGGSND
jgi:hypothetical protein